jgi:hypothetical protein
MIVVQVAKKFPMFYETIKFSNHTYQSQFWVSYIYQNKELLCRQNKIINSFMYICQNCEDL